MINQFSDMFPYSLFGPSMERFGPYEFLIFGGSPNNAYPVNQLFKCTAAMESITCDEMAVPQQLPPRSYHAAAVSEVRISNLI